MPGFFLMLCHVRVNVNRFPAEAIEIDNNNSAASGRCGACAWRSLSLPGACVMNWRCSSRFSQRLQRFGIQQFMLPRSAGWRLMRDASVELRCFAGWSNGDASIQKSRALYDTADKFRKAIVMLSGPMNNRADLGKIAIIRNAAKPVCV